ncbi:MAG TPA: ABC transporter ATP-binding protein [Tepidiformaceae bacterium]|nr:ABC transporter ATP-binding protein [Tepidiformaceae bacterium]
MSENVIEARGLSKRYGATVAVDGVSLTVERGRVFGTLGPNGSGKSTTVRMLLGLIRPDAGEVRLFDHPLRDHGHRLLRRVGAVVETPAFIPYLSGRDNLRLLTRYMPGPSEADISATLDRVHLIEAADRRFKNYSLGMKQRLGIAAAMLHNPELIILDEPTNGLDPQGTREVRQLIPELAAEGRTVMLCSHLLHEVEQVCDAVAIFQRGRVIAQGTTTELIGHRSQLEVRTNDLPAAITLLGQSPWAQRVARNDGYIRIDGAGDDGEAVNRWLAMHGLYASVLRPVSQGLEDVFFELTGEESHD